MTTTPNKKTLDVPVDVRFTATGIPLAVRYNWRIWAVAAMPEYLLACIDQIAPAVGIGGRPRRIVDHVG
ncbi:hypothetical protein [Paeniglutamicibacter kerguelensis]|uniref:Uncharacterized protein n=1 Tax=Paeniglutamicibacter kerguelensis TaxID=254788 RepID=A0ABS4XE88_9MICC|nr:hypothetical protein [Paeniglutamicibacter kerguelensis]MBP2386780.1 hypothetical protein [Paeniglutamicibacter kerguelensis]